MVQSLKIWHCQGLSDGNTTLWSTHGCGVKGSGILTIHQMLFTGYNMLSHSDNNSIYSGCQYGGFFVGSVMMGGSISKSVQISQRKAFLPIITLQYV